MDYSGAEPPSGVRQEKQQRWAEVLGGASVPLEWMESSLVKVGWRREFSAAGAEGANEGLRRSQA